MPLRSLFFSWLVCSPPIRQPGTIKGALFKHLNAYFCPCRHSSLLGQIIIITVPSSLLVITLFSIYWLMSGMRQASVLPLPVEAFAITSFWVNMDQKQLICILVSVLIQFLINESLVIGLRLNLSSGFTSILPQTVTIYGLIYYGVITLISDLLAIMAY